MSPGESMAIALVGAHHGVSFKTAKVMMKTDNVLADWGYFMAGVALGHMAYIKHAGPPLWFWLGAAAGDPGLAYERNLGLAPLTP